MLNLCICDDLPEDLAALEKLAKYFIQEHLEFQIRIRTFQDPYDLLDEISRSGGFDLYLLDVIMPHMTGITLAKHIRERRENAEILFLTTSREYAVEAFGVKASGYLLKPVQKTAFDKAVYACIKNLAPKENPTLLLKVRDGIRKIQIQDLVLVESFNHTCVLLFSDGTTLETSVSLSALFQQLETYPCFYKPHRAYIVNMDYVCGLTASDLLLVNSDKRIPISRGGHNRMKTAYLDYMAKKKIP